MTGDGFLDPGDVELMLAGGLLLAALVWQFGERIGRMLDADCFSNRQRSVVGFTIIVGAVLIAGFAAHCWAGWVYEQTILCGIQ